MLQFNLKKLLAERKMTISDLAIKTGISRKTISQMVNNESKGVQFATLEPVMQTLNASVDEIIIKSPVSAVVSFLPLSAVDIGISESNQTTDANDISGSIVTQVVDISGEDDGSVHTEHAVLYATCLKTSDGNLIGNVSPAFSDKSDKKLERELASMANSFMNFIQDIDHDVLKRMTISILAILLSHAQQTGKDLHDIDEKSMAMFSWSREENQILDTVVLTGSDFFPAKKHITTKLTQNEGIAIVNADLDQWLNSFKK